MEQKKTYNYSLRIGYSNGQYNDIDNNHSVWKIHGRSNKAVDFYGVKEIHDFSGMVSDDRITLDLEHSIEDVVGYADNITILNNELVMDGHVFRDLPAGDTVYKMLKNGVPLQASVTFTSYERDDIGKGETAEVNSTTVDGPVLIYRRWKLESIAVCRYGVDDSTCVSQFKKKEKKMETKKKSFSECQEEEEKKECLAEGDEPEPEKPEDEPKDEPKDETKEKIAALEKSVSKLSEAVNGLIAKQQEFMAEGDEPEPTEEPKEGEKEEMSKKLDELGNRLDTAIKLFSKTFGAEPEKFKPTKNYSNPYDELADIEREKLNQKG